MHAYVLRTNRRIAPFDHPVAEMRVHNRPLATLQTETLRRAGCAVESIESLEQVHRLPALLVSDDLYFSAAALSGFLNAAERGQLLAPAEDMTGASPRGTLVNGRAALAVSELTEKFASTFQGKRIDGPDGAAYRAYNCYYLRTLDPARPLEAQAQLAPVRHKVRFVRARANRYFEPSGRFQLPVCSVFMTPVHHWSCLIAANLLGMPGYLLSLFRDRPGHGLSLPVRAAWRSGSLRPARLAGKLYLRGRRCRVHPSAHVEGAVLGNRVRIEPNAVVKACVIGDGACIGPGAVLEGCTVGAEATVNGSVMVRCCVVGAGANVGSFFTQFSVVGRGAAMCPDSGVLDYQFHESVHVDFQGRSVPSGSRLLGACLGDRAFLGPGVKMLAGQELPNDTILVPSPRNLVRGLDRPLPEHVIQLDGRTGRPKASRRRRAA